MPQTLLPEARDTAPPTPPARWQRCMELRVGATRQQQTYPAADHASQRSTLVVRVHTDRDSPAASALRTHCADRGPSTRRRKSFRSLDSQSLALVRPLERVRHRAIVIVDESEDFGLQVVNREEMVMFCHSGSSFAHFHLL